MNGTSLLSKKDCGDRNPDDLDEHLSGGHQGIEEPGPEGRPWEKSRSPCLKAGAMGI